jgi:nucleoid-associated protein YgaU
MARVIVILSLMIAITAGMFALTRTSTVAPGEAANGPSATVKLSDLPKPEAVGTPADLKPDDDGETSLTAAEPRPVTNSVEALKSTQDVTQGPVAGAAPSVDTAGIDHRGKASFTGTATPGDTVSLIWDGKPLRTATADPKGSWSIEFKAPIKRDEHELYVAAKGKDGNVVIGPQRATIRPAATDSGLPRITLKTTEQAPAAPQGGPGGAPEPKTGLVVEKITLGDAGTTVLTGKADPGAMVKVAINGMDAGDVRVAADGTWTLIAPNPSGKAADHVRLQLIGAEGAKLDEAELPYKVPATAPKVAVAETKEKTDSAAVVPLDPIIDTKASAKTAPAAEDLVAAFKPDIAKPNKPKRKIIRVRRGDSLWRISRRHLGNGKKWATFYKLNKRKIDNPNLIYPGQTLIIPG